MVNRNEFWSMTFINIPWRKKHRIGTAKIDNNPDTHNRIH